MIAEVASSIATSIAVGDESWRNRLRELDEAIGSGSGTTASRIAAMHRVVHGSRWNEVYVAKIAATLPLVEGIGSRKYAVLASKHAPTDIERYRSEVVKSVANAIKMAETLAEECDAAIDFRASAIGTGYDHDRLESAVGSFLNSISQTSRVLATESAVVLESEAVNGSLPRLAEFHDFLAGTIESSRAALAFATVT